MNATTLSAIGTGALKLAASAPVKGLIRRFLHKVWKKIRLKSVRGIIVQDFVKNAYNISLDTDKYRVIELETVYLSMLSDGDIANYRRLKQVSPESWVLAYTGHLKALLNSIRWNYNDKAFVVVLTSIDLAKKLHIKTYSVFHTSQELFKQNLDRFDKESVRYHEDQLKSFESVTSSDFDSEHELNKMIKKYLA